MSIKILIAEDYDVLRENIKSFVSKQPDIDVIGEARDGESAVELSRNLSPDVVIMDISLPKLNWIEATGKILRDNSAVRIIMLSTYSYKDLVEAVLKAGVMGYVLKTSIFEDLIQAVQTVVANEFFLSPQIKNIDICGYTKQSPKLTSSMSKK